MSLFGVRTVEKMFPKSGLSAQLKFPLILLYNTRDENMCLYICYDVFNHHDGAVIEYKITNAADQQRWYQFQSEEEWYEDE